ncbi:hypothetical protein HDU82_000116, partial [Entophlyctis luteolus]
MLSALAGVAREATAGFPWLNPLFAAAQAPRPLALDAVRAANERARSYPPLAAAAPSTLPKEPGAFLLFASPAGRRYAAAGVFRLAADACALLSALAVRAISAACAASQSPPLTTAIALPTMLLVLQLAQTLCANSHLQITMDAGVRVKALLMRAIYAKAISAGTGNGRTSGRIVNLFET